MRTLLPKLVLSCLLFTGVAQHGRAAANAPHSPGDSIFIIKQAVSRSYKIALYPDADQKVVFFSVKGEDGRAYQLFLFDLEGRLITQTEIRNRQTTVIRDLQKGTYEFDVFSDDIKIGNGQMTVK